MGKSAQRAPSCSRANSAAAAAKEPLDASAMSASLERRHSKRLQTRQGSAPYVKPDKSGDNSTGLTKYMGESSLDWDGDAQRRCAALVHHPIALSARHRSWRHLCSCPLARAAVSPSSSAASSPLVAARRRRRHCQRTGRWSRRRTAPLARRRCTTSTR